jgi:transposase InsO family protein
VHADFFEVAGRHYLVMTDEFSGCPMLYDVGQDTTANMVTRCLRQWFVQWGVPTVLRSDNGPQFVAAQTQAFLRQWGVTFDPSSPRLPYTNGRAEAAVKAMKRLVRGATPFSAQRPDEDAIAAGLLAFRNTPRYGGRSPAELAFGRRSGEGLPTHWHSIEDPRWAADVRELDERAQERREQLGRHYESTTRPLEPFPPGTPVAVQEHGNNGKTSWPIRAIVSEVWPKHQYVVRMENGRTLVRNRVQLARRYIYGTAQSEGEQGQPGPDVPGLPQPPPVLPAPVMPPPPPPSTRSRRGRSTSAGPPRSSSRPRKPNPLFTGGVWTT